MFFWIPAIVPLLLCIAILLSPLWPVTKGQGGTDRDIPRNWKKFGMFFGLNLLSCLIVAAMMWGGAVSKSYFPEVWNYRITGIRHEMEWIEREQRTREVYDGTESYTDSNGNTQTRTKYRTEVYYVTAHYGPYWKALDEYGEWNKVSNGCYGEWKGVWKNEKQTGMHEGSAAGFDRAIDGPIYECRWPRSFDTVFPWSEIHRYQNKIRVSNSVFRYGTPDKASLKKYPRPADEGNSSPVVCYGGSGVSPDEKMVLRRVNANFGTTHQIHAMLVMLGKDDPRTQVEDILKAWGGPNKNELVTFVSVKDGSVTFCEVHSWMDDTTLHAVLRDALMAETWSAKRYADLLLENVPKLWKRKHFTPVNEYLRIPINPAWFWLAIVVSLLAGIGMFFAVERFFDSGSLVSSRMRYGMNTNRW